jgi:hypothetical protein
MTNREDSIYSSLSNEFNDRNHKHGRSVEETRPSIDDYLPRNSKSILHQHNLLLKEEPSLFNNTTTISNNDKKELNNSKSYFDKFNNLLSNLEDLSPK